MALAVQAAVLDRLQFDAFPFGQDGFRTTEVDISRGQVADTLAVAAIVVVVDESGDGGLEVAFKELVLEQDAVLEGLVPEFDFALGLRWRFCSLRWVNGRTQQSAKKHLITGHKLLPSIKYRFRSELL